MSEEDHDTDPYCAIEGGAFAPTPVVDRDDLPKPGVHPEIVFASGPTVKLRPRWLVLRAMVDTPVEVRSCAELDRHAICDDNDKGVAQYAFQRFPAAQVRVLLVPAEALFLQP